MKYFFLVLWSTNVMGAQLYSSPVATQKAQKAFELKISTDTDVQAVIKIIMDAVERGEFRVKAAIKQEKAKIMLDYLWHLGYNITNKLPSGNNLTFEVEWR